MPAQRTMLYVPYNASPHGQWTVRRGAEVVGTYKTRADAVRHALMLASVVRAQLGGTAELRVEDESGVWRVVNAGAA
jgi:hypothetical protein